MERLGWRERELRGGLDTLPRPDETTFEDEDFANCFIAGGAIGPSSPDPTAVGTHAPGAGTAGEELDAGEVYEDSGDVETNAGAIVDRRAGEPSAPHEHDTRAPRTTIANEPLDWRRPEAPPAPRPRVRVGRLLGRPEPAARRRRQLPLVAALLATVSGAVAVAGVAGAFGGSAAPSSRSTTKAGRAQLTAQASSRGAAPPSDQLLHRRPAHAVTHVAARHAAHPTRAHRGQQRRRPGHPRTRRRATAASTPAATSNTSSTGSSTGSYSGSSSASYTGASSTSASTSEPAASQSASVASAQHTSSTQPAFGQNGSLGPGRGASGTQ